MNGGREGHGDSTQNCRVQLLAYIINARDNEDCENFPGTSASIPDFGRLRGRRSSASNADLDNRPKERPVTRSVCSAWVTGEAGVFEYTQRLFPAQVSVLAPEGGSVTFARGNDRLELKLGDRRGTSC